MKRSFAEQFYLAFFTATRRVSGSWLACLGPQQRVQMLDELMQWHCSYPCALHRHHRSHQV